MYKRLSDHMFETTTSSSIAYLPGGFTSIQSIIAPLIKTKRTWKVKVENHPLKQQYKFWLGHLDIDIKHKDWKSFESDMSKLGLVKQGDKENFFQFHSNLINESLNEQLNDIQYVFVRELESLVIEPPISECVKSLQFWLSNFGGKILKPETVAIHLVKGSLTKFADAATAFYGNDRGAYEMLIDHMQQRRSLKFDELFENYQYVFGAMIDSTYHSINLKFRSFIDLNFVPSEQITINTDNPKILEELDGYSNVKLVKNEIYPKGKTFQFSFINVLKKEINDMEDVKSVKNSD